MKQLIFLVCLLVLTGNQAFCQQTHFIYLQTENREPFYVLLNKKNYSSSPIGYVILPKLTNGEYNIRIGFAKNAGTEQDYVLQVKDNEQGYLVKDFGEKGWALFNLQSLDLQYAGAISKERNNLAALQKTQENEKAAAIAAANEAKRIAEEAANALAKQKDDSVTAAAETKRKAEEAAAVVIKEKDDEAILEAKRKADALAADEKRKADELAAEKKKIEEAKQQVVKEPVRDTTSILVAKVPDIPKPEIKPVDVVIPLLINRIKTDSGFIYKYAVTNADGKDTVNAFIKGTTPIPGTTSTEIGDKPKENATETNTAKDPVKFLNMDFKQDSTEKDANLIEPVFNKANAKPINPVTEVKKAADSATVPVPEKSNTVVAKWDNNVRVESSINKASPGTLPNSNCKAQADDKDFFSLRKKMVAEEGTDEMVIAAKKAMKEKCFTTTQVRNLSVLFLNDADRYQFLDAVYPFTYDAYQYEKLADLLIDNYYVQRFKSMIRK
ncbi:MAG: DUF4476 domain-containing protein [Bacteroidota bacterium]